MAKLLRLKDLLPDYYAGVYDMDVLVQVEQPILDDLQAQIDTVQKNQFAILADENGISIFESMLGFTDTAGQDLETRRYNVIIRLLPPKPVTIRYLREVLEALNINADLIVDAAAYHVEVTARTTDNSAMKRLSLILKRLLPANLTFTTFNFENTSTEGEMITGTDALYNTTMTNKGGNA